MLLQLEVLSALCLHQPGYIGVFAAQIVIAMFLRLSIPHLILSCQAAAPPVHPSKTRLKYAQFSVLLVREGAGRRRVAANATIYRHRIRKSGDDLEPLVTLFTILPPLTCPLIYPYGDATICHRPCHYSQL